MILNKMWKILGFKIYDKKFFEFFKNKSFFKGKCIIVSFVFFFNYN